MLSKFEHVRIKGISVVVPPKEICIYDEAEYYENSIKKIDRMRKMVGFYKRRVSEDGVTPSDYGIAAAEKLIADMKLDKNSIDALVNVVQKPDFMAPATAYYIHKKLGLSENCAAYDVNQGCVGWVYGTWIAAQMLESGVCKRVLLITADTPSAGVDVKDRINAPVFGDGGCATLLECSTECEKIFFNIETFSGGYETLTVPTSIYTRRCYFNLVHKKEDLEMFLDMIKNPIQTQLGQKATIFDDYMDGVAVFNFTMEKAPPNIKAVMEFAAVKEEDIAWLCLHQANKQIIQTVGTKVGFSLEKVPYYAFENYGNNTMVSIPTTINTVVKENRTGKTKLVCSGFGNGLSVASSVIVLDDDVYLSGIMDYIKPVDFITREEYINYWKKKLQGEQS
jgi:3-oxoacyl-[acyl-carrier-protein] synthase-3